MADYDPVGGVPALENLEARPLVGPQAGIMNATQCSLKLLVGASEGKESWLHWPARIAVGLTTVYTLTKLAYFTVVNNPHQQRSPGMPLPLLEFKSTYPGSEQARESVTSMPVMTDDSEHTRAEWLVDGDENGVGRAGLSGHAGESVGFAPGQLALCSKQVAAIQFPMAGLKPTLARGVRPYELRDARRDGAFR